MITFLTGLVILVVGYIFYSGYIEKQFAPDKRETPATKDSDGVDFIPLSKTKNILIHLLNIAGMGPILGAIQGILFGPVAFLLIPIGAVFMGGVHDYFAGMLSVRNDGAQVTDLIKKYFGNFAFKFAMLLVFVMLILVTAVFVYTSGDIIADRFFYQTDFSFNNPIILILYLLITLYFIIATLFPIDKIIGKLYPLFTSMLILGSLLVVWGFITKGVHLEELNIHHLNMHKNGLHLLPMFFMTVSCGLLSGFHSTQATIVSRTITSEKEGKLVFYGMMCVESLIAMIWAAAAMHMYSLHLVPDDIVGTVNVVNDIADTFVPAWLVIIVTLAVVILPITSGDTALRSLRMAIGNALNLKQNIVINRLKIIIPISLCLLGILYWAKTYPNGFQLVWRYFNFGNQLVSIPTFLYATIFLYKQKKNYFITLIPGLFFVYITMSFIFDADIGFNVPYKVAQILGILMTLIVSYYMVKRLRKN